MDEHHDEAKFSKSLERIEPLENFYTTINHHLQEKGCRTCLQKKMNSLASRECSIL